jgi:hypothetical protein
MAFELAERLGGMTAFELMDRMSVEEMRLWVEFDMTHIRKQDYQYATLMGKLDWIKGVRRPKAEPYLPRVKKQRKRKTLAEIKANFNAAVINSGGRKRGG